MKRPSPSMVVACTALFVALSGSAIAGGSLITGAQIKDHSIGFNDLSAAAVGKLRGHAGPAGAAGPAGPAGPAGANGGFDPSKVTYVAGAQTTVPASGNPTTLTATCPSGTKVVGGGAAVGPSLMVASGPDGSSNSWTVIAINLSDQDYGQAAAFAVCVAP